MNLILTFDLEKLVVPYDLGKEFTSDPFLVSETGLEKIMKLLDRHGTTSTFFTTLDFANKYPEQMIKILENGHELSLHGLSHKDYSAMKPQEAARELKGAKKSLDKRLGCNIIGFRAPRLRPPEPGVLKKSGFKYDSSITSGGLDYLYNKLVRIPISVTPHLKLPFSWIWFRNFGLNYAKLCTKSCLLRRRTIVIYFHPWDFADLGKYDFPYPFVRNSGEKCARMLDTYLTWTDRIGMESMTISGFIHDIRSGDET